MLWGPGRPFHALKSSFRQYHEDPLLAVRAIPCSSLRQALPSWGTSIPTIGLQDNMLSTTCIMAPVYCGVKRNLAAYHTNF